MAMASWCGACDFWFEMFKIGSLNIKNYCILNQTEVGRYNQCFMPLCGQADDGLMRLASNFKELIAELSATEDEEAREQKILMLKCIHLIFEINKAF
jgi:hypothetical protein